MAWLCGTQSRGQGKLPPNQQQQGGENKRIPVVQTPPQQKEGLGCSRSAEHRNTGLRYYQLEQCST